MMIENLQYRFISAGYLLPAALVIFLLFWILKKRNQTLLHFFAQPKTLEKILSPQPRYNFWIKTSLLILAWVFTTFTLMQPEGNPHYSTNNLPPSKKESTQKRKPHEIHLYIDSSRSMLVNDETSQSTRLDHGKDISSAILDSLQDNEVALYSFSGLVTQLSPLTLDPFFPKILLQDLAIVPSEKGGTDFKVLIDNITNQIEKSKAYKTFIIISDGEDAKLSLMNSNKKKEEIAHIIESLPGGENYQIFTIGTGSEKGGTVPNVLYDGKPVISHLDEQFLLEVAKKGNGTYYAASTSSPIDLAQKIEKQILQKDSYYSSEEFSKLKVKSSYIIYDHYFQYPLFLAILSLLGVLLIPNGAIKKLTFAFLLFSSAPLLASLDSADLYYQAGNYDKAIEIYEEMLKLTDKEWDKSVIQYNLANAQLKNGQFESAIYLYDTLIQDKQQSPLIQARSSLNKTFSLYRLGEVTSSPVNKLLLLRQAKAEALKAAELFCKLEKEIGAKECSSSPQIPLLQQTIEKEMEKSFQELSSWQQEEYSPLLVSTLLFAHINQLISNISFLVNEAYPAGKGNDYRSLFLYQAETWIPLVESLKQADQDESLLKAKQYYILGFRMLNQSEYKASQEAFSSALSFLENALKNLIGQQSEQQLLQKLILGYRGLRVENPPQQTSIEALIIAQETLAEKKELSLETATEYLKKAAAASEVANWPDTRVYSELARQEVMNLLQDPSKQASPIEWIRQLIQKQKQAIALGQLNHSFVVKRQKEIVKQGDRFFPIVFSAQKQYFFDEHLCQVSPWDQALPLFAKGLAAANAAIKSPASLPLQQETLSLWKKVLALLDQTKQKKEELHEREAINEIFHQLKEMEGKDRPIKEAKPLPVQEGLAW